ncbi:hypothetical protein ADICYQ_4185 [Cyclobacterium qasimii M12-11B]|uniref:Uncharacterized protein n=1 Tax=Cyclobacterium qasimii M12-11B TaxID=641524 RepID=S7WRN9_9BACT|nr:hypothetical protein ADICYQ_4185 [Cyclobacterium qasimii M12-11B]
MLLSILPDGKASSPLLCHDKISKQPDFMAIATLPDELGNSIA